MLHITGDVAEEILKDFLMVKVADLNQEKTIRSSKGLALLLNPKDSSSSDCSSEQEDKNNCTAVLRATWKGRPG